MKRKIRNIECTSIGKKLGNNDDDIYVGENFAAVIDGVSHKSSIEINGKKIKIANIITEALRKIDRPTAPDYAKTLEMKEFIQYINMYIRKYCERINYPIEEKPLEATGVIYSKYHNEIWSIGDCRAIYDGKTVQNDLKIDNIYIQIRTALIETLLGLGYSEKELFENDIARIIIENPKIISKYIKDDKELERSSLYIKYVMYKTLLKCGFTERQIKEKNLLKKYYNPKILQQFLKNNPNVGEYGYSVFNGVNTELKNCVLTKLPDDVKQIKLFSDGIPMEVSKNSKDLGQTIRKIRTLAKKDPLSINENKALHNAVKQSDRSNHLAVDDASSVIIEIEYVKERDEER